MLKKTFTLFALACFFGSSYAQLNPEQKLIRQTFFNFLKFYQKNEIKFNSFKLYKGTSEEDGPPFKVQWKEVERYFSYLRANVPFVGEAYIKAERNHFKYADSCFKADPEEEIAAGFDYDRWAGGQESIEYTIKWYTSVKNKYQIIIKGNKAELRIGGELFDGAEEKDRSWSIVPFVKEKGIWKMADNIYPMETEESTEN